MARRLFLVNTLDEVKQTLQTFNDKFDKVIALSLAAEFYLISQLPKWQNPLYDFLETSGSTCNYNFLLPHFKVAYDFAKDENLVPIRDRLGYYFSELDRSLRFAKKVVDKLAPEKIMLGSLQEYPGASVINGSLKNHAFYIVAQEKNIPFQFFLQKPQRKPLKQILGKILSQINWFKKSVKTGTYDLIILGPPRHIFQLKQVIGDLKKLGLSVYLLTYTLTYFYKNKLDKLGFDYHLKETLIDGKLKSESKNMLSEIIKANPWRNFHHPTLKNKFESSFLQNKIKEVIKEELLENIENKFASQKFFNSISAKILLTTTDPDSKAIYFIKEAKSRKIKTLALQHGVMWSPAPPSVVPISEKFIAWSNLSRTWLKKIKEFENVNILIGQSPFHRLWKKTTFSTKKGPVKILYLVTIVILDINMVAYWQKRLFEILEQFGNCEIVVRVHPFQNTTNLGAIINNSTLSASFDRNEDLCKSIADSDLVIFEETTAGFDAMLAGKPTIFFNPYSGEDYFEAKKRDYAMTILSQKEIDEKLLKYLNESDKWKYYAEKGNVFAQKYLGIYNAKSNNLARVIALQISND